MKWKDYKKTLPLWERIYLKIYGLIVRFKNQIKE